MSARHSKARTVVVGASLALAACSKPAPPTLTPLRANVAQVTAQGVDLFLQLGAENPNTSDLVTQSITAHVVVDGRVDLGTVTLPNAVTFPAGKTTTLDVPVSVKWTDLPTVVMLAASNRAVPYSVEGTVALGGSLINVGVPYKIEAVMTHDQIVKATLAGLPALKLP
jgi:LEA14-like dessication related protein